MMIVGSQLDKVVQKFPTKVVKPVVKSSGILNAQDISTSYENIKMSSIKFKIFLDIKTEKTKEKIVMIYGFPCYFSQ